MGGVYDVETASTQEARASEYLALSDETPTKRKQVESAVCGVDCHLHCHEQLPKVGKGIEKIALKNERMSVEPGSQRVM
jgi:hypothetical protein